MGDTAGKMKDALRNFINSTRGLTTMQGEVIAVDETNWTCDVQLPNTLVIYDVLLKALKETPKSCVLVPKIGSTVQMLNVGEPFWLAIAIEDVDKVIMMPETELKIDAAGSTLLLNKDGLKVTGGTLDINSGGSTMKADKNGIVMNGGKNGGVPVAKKVEDNDNSLKDYITALKNAVSAALVTVDTAAGSASATTFNTTMGALQMNIQKTENTKVKH